MCVLTFFRFSDERKEKLVVNMLWRRLIESYMQIVSGHCGDEQVLL